MSEIYLTRIRLEQYRSFRHLDIRLPDGPGVLVVQGSNGIGKSSLFDGLEWALTDKIDHFRDADGVKKVGSYLCRWRKDASGSSSVTMEFSGNKTISRVLSSPEAKASVTDGNIGDITEFLKDETWARNISGLSRYLLLTHFLGQSSLSRLTNRDPGERFDILKEAAESKEIEDVANALHGKGSTKAARAYNSRIKSLNDESAALQVLLDTEANLWTSLTGIGALDDAAAGEAARQVSRLLEDDARATALVPVVAFDQDTIGNLDILIDGQRARLRGLEASLNTAQSTLDEWQSASRQMAEQEAAKTIAIGQVGSLVSQREDSTAALAGARAAEAAANAVAEAIESSLTLLTGLHSARIAETSARARKSSADVALEAARTSVSRETAAVSAFDRRLLIIRRIEDDVRRLDERAQLAQSEHRDVLLWLAHDSRVSDVQSSIQALQTNFPTLDADIDEALGDAQHADAFVDEQEVVLTELRKTVSAMSSAVASVAANLLHDACDCPVCATHFEAEGELQRRAAAAASRLAPLVLAQEERTRKASQRSGAANNRVAQLRAVKLQLNNLFDELQAEERGRTEKGIGAFGAAAADRLFAEEQRIQLETSAEKIARLRQRKWYWRNRLSGDFFTPGGEQTVAIRKRDQAQLQLNTATQDQSAASDVLESAVASVHGFVKVLGELDDVELAVAIRSTETDMTAAGENSRELTRARQFIEDQLASIEVALPGARTRLQQATDQVTAAAARKAQAKDAWRTLAFAESDIPEELSISLLTTTIGQLREKLREAEDIMKRLRDGRAAKALVENHLVALERLRSSISGAPNSERLQLRKEAEDQVSAKTRLAQATRKAKEIAQAASSEILDELADFNTSYMQPLDTLMKAINRAIMGDPRVGLESYVKNRRVEQRPVKEGEALPPEVASIDPRLVHSEGQMAALSVSMLCAASLTYPWSRWRGLVLDDPLQHNDIIHAAAFSDFICNLVANRGYQVLLSTHDRAQAEFLRRKMASRNLPCAVLSLLGTGQDGVEWKFREADSQMPLAAFG
jgi:exonuclease SbcC